MMKAILVMVIALNLLFVSGFLFINQNEHKIDTKITKLYRDEYVEMSAYLISKHNLSKQRADFWAVPFVNAAKRFDFKPKTLSTIVRIETNYRSCDSSFIATQLGNDKLKEYALGPYQIKPSTAKMCCDEMGMEFKVSMLHDPEVSTIIAAYYLKKLMLMFDNDLESAVKAYNVGPDAYRKRLSLESQDKFYQNFLLYYN